MNHIELKAERKVNMQPQASSATILQLLEVSLLQHLNQTNG